MSIRGFGREEGRKGKEKGRGGGREERGKERRTETRVDLVLEPPSLTSRGKSVRLVLACDLERRLVLKLLGESVGAQDERCGVGRVVVFEEHGMLYARGNPKCEISQLSIRGKKYGSCEGTNLDVVGNEVLDLTAELGDALLSRRIERRRSSDPNVAVGELDSSRPSTAVER